MRKILTIAAAAAMLIAGACTAQVGKPAGVAESTYTATFRVGEAVAESTYTATFHVAEPKTISPAGSADADMPDLNDWGFDSWVFMEVTVPTFKLAEVEVEKGVEVGEDVPVLTFSPNDGWKCIDESWDDGVWFTRWFYEEPVESGASFTPLFDSWTMTNFRVHSGICGSHTYSDLIDAMNKVNVERFSLQSTGISGAPEELWKMIGTHR